jgi:hypothetical protein
MDSEEEILIEGNSTAGAIKKLILNIVATRESLQECGYKRIMIDSSKASAVVEMANGSTLSIPTIYNNDTTTTTTNNDDDDDDDEDEKEEEEEEDDDDEDHEDHDDDDDEKGGHDEDHDEDHDLHRKRRKTSEVGRPALSGPTSLMGMNLHRLLESLHKLPYPAPTRNPEFFPTINIYNEALLKKLESSAGPDAFLEVHKIYLKVPDFSTSSTTESAAGPGSLAYILNNRQSLDDVEFFDIPDVIPEVFLLKLSGTEFTESKELAIKTLALQIVKIYDKVLKDCIMEEVSRRSRLRYYVSILNIYRKIEIYCSLHELRKKGETIKNQAMKKIIKHSKPSRDSPPKFFFDDFKNIIRASKRIERLIAISANNWGIVDAFPNLDVDFFKSTSISVGNYERFLKLVETGQLISIEDGNQLYNNFKIEQNRQRKIYIQNIYDDAATSSS